MGVGHAAVGVAAVRWAPRLNAGWLVFAALLADFLLGVFAQLGLEHAYVPVDYAQQHYLTFSFPLSHGLLPLLGWAGLFATAVAMWQPIERRRAFVVIALVVLSHFVLDAIVHVAGLPVAGENSPKIGFGLWRQLPLELALETLMSIAAVAAFWPAAAPSKLSRYGVTCFLAVFCVMTWSPLFMTQPPTAAQLIPGWIASPILFGATVYWLDRQRARGLP